MSQKYLNLLALGDWNVVILILVNIHTFTLFLNYSTEYQFLSIGSERKSL